MKASEIPSFVLCATPAFEMSVRFCGNLYNVKIEEENPQLNHDLAGNLIGATFLGICAFDTFPGARLCGSICFIAYSILNKKQQNPYWTSQPIHKLWEHKGKTVVLLVGGYLTYRYTPQETVSKIRDILFKVFTNV